jgi:hypothetical protein
MFYLVLEPVLYNGSYSPDTSSIDFNITPQSDYSSVELTCTVDDHATYPCWTLTERYYCSTTFILSLSGRLGCNYTCYFVTKKYNYIDKNSDEFKLTSCECLFLSTMIVLKNS